MRLIEAGQAWLAAKNPLAPEEWRRLNQTMIALIQTCSDIEELREFIALDQSFVYPPFVTHKTLEKLIELHDFSENTLWRYVTQLSMYWSADGYEEVENYLFEQLKNLHARNAAEAEYIPLGEDVWKKIQEFHKELPDWEMFWH